jgi:hypothetical protein
MDSMFHRPRQTRKVSCQSEKVRRISISSWVDFFLISQGNEIQEEERLKQRNLRSLM